MPAAGAGRVRRAGGLRRSGARERGTVTAELALALPAVVLVLVVVLTAGAAAVTHVRCADAARAGARAAALGEQPAVVTQVVQELAGPAADVVVGVEDGWVVVTVTRPVAVGLGWDGLRATATARTPAEPDGAPGAGP
ncbi:TadE family type IV pilus minor pilin [Georgenia faecalis]|uniref:TadE family type IV pilus minor pilin n=1 Tax=Georgenia faecalis TaxID=2483799 RepID=A0ABV9D683_9MICO|nr:TadE family type IV pilus minor pilin [Georgenia faecalis]